MKRILLVGISCLIALPFSGWAALSVLADGCGLFEVFLRLPDTLDSLLFVPAGRGKNRYTSFRTFPLQ